MAQALAVLSDIHGNARALDAVLSDISRRGIVDIVNLGDCAYGPFDPRPVMDRLLEFDLPTTSGNEDRILVEATQGMLHSRTAVFSAKFLERAHVEWLACLPLLISVRGTLLCHGTPDDDSSYLLTAVEDSGTRVRMQSEIESSLRGYNHSLVLCGHDHTPRIMTLESGRWIVDPGSVGCPAYKDDTPMEHAIKTGSPHARYAIVERVGDTVSAELIAVDYDWGAASREAEVNGFPDWAHRIATGCV